MGQKVNPYGIRLGVIKNWNSVWFANNKNFSEYLENDYKVRQFLKKRLLKASVSKIVLERLEKNLKITIFTARPGIVIGRKGEDIEKLRKLVSLISNLPTKINISEIQKPELDAKLVSENIASQLERRIMFRRAMKRSIQNSMRQGALGIKVEISGRLGGAEIARTEWHREGRVPLHTLRADIDYNCAQAYTTYGVVGVKVWIFKGEILDGMPKFFHKKDNIQKKTSNINNHQRKSRNFNVRKNRFYDATKNNKV